MKGSLLILVFIAAATLSATERNTSDAHSWGRVEWLRENIGGVSYRLSFAPRSADESDPSSDRHVMFYALRPNQRVQFTVRHFETGSSDQHYGTRRAVYMRDNDSSMIRVLMQTVGQTDLPAVSASPQVRITRYEYFRGYFVARIEITPFVLDARTNTVVPVKSLDLDILTVASGDGTASHELKKSDSQFDTLLRDMIINYQDAVPYEPVWLPFSATSWFNTSSQYLKLAIGRDGIYRLTYEQLKSFFPGILTADPRTIQLYHDGQESPLYVAGESDGTLDAGDYIEFPALMNYTYKHRIITTGLTEYNEYLNRYSDSTIYWLTYGTGSGLRMSSNPAAFQTVDTLSTYTSFRHVETNTFLQFSGDDVFMQQNSLWTSHDMWGGSFLNGNSTWTVTVPVTDAASNGDSLRAYVKFVSWGADISLNAHTLSFRFNNGADVGERTFNRFDEGVISAAIPFAQIKNNANNTIGLFSKPTAAKTVNSIIPDWMEVEYPRLLKAVNDSLAFDFRSLTSRNLRTVRVTNFSTRDIAVYKIRPVVEKISNLTFSASAPYTLTFSDTVGPQEQYLVIANTRPLQPVVMKAKRFTGISTDKRQTDYLIVTHEKFQSEAMQYAQFIASTKGWTTKVVNVDDIFDEYGYGYRTPESMRDYFRSALTWNAPVPAYLFLVGDASYDYKFAYGNRKAINYVPSYGYPVSDPLLVTFDSLSILPQMYVGRLPVNNVGEVTAYLNRIQTYIATPNSEWNKRYLFFTGGDPASAGQIESFRAVNDKILNEFIRPAPLGGIGTHFYKTTNPQSDFGPYTNQQIKEAISLGGVFISYIGHSGTQTWDNSIGDPVQLQNAQGKFPLITDFGCSTGKFAEPQVTSFSELFVIGPTSSAIGYIGNSALGFTTIAAQLPLEFYRRMCKDSVRTIGKAHLYAKTAMVSANPSLVNTIMLYTNTLVGDPSLDIAIPDKPNITVNSEDITTPGSVMETSDSISVGIRIKNFGSVVFDSVDIRIEHSYEGRLVNMVIRRRPVPLLSDSLVYFMVVKNQPGEHIVKVTGNPSQDISEISLSDNSAQKSIFVLSSNFKIVQPVERNNGRTAKIVLLNPFASSKDTAQMVLMQVDTTEAFLQPATLHSKLGLVITEFDVNSFPPGKRYWWRAKLDNPSSVWTTGSFFQGTLPGTMIGQTDSVEWGENTLINTTIEPRDFHSIRAKLSENKLVLRAISSGSLDGNFGVIELNGFNLLDNSFGRGHSIVVFDTVTYSVVGTRTFDLYGRAAEADSLIAFINRLQTGLIVAAVIIDEGSNNFSTAARNAYSLIGASQAKNLGWRDSWAVIGKKGAPPGSALEVFKPSTTGKAIVETTLTKFETAGRIITPEVGPAAQWKKLTIAQTVPNGARSTVKIIGLKPDGKVDTLIVADSSKIDLSIVNPITYPRIRLQFDLQANTQNQSPEISYWSTEILIPAELALNYQVVKGFIAENGGVGREVFEGDTVMQGERVALQYRVFNGGQAAVGKFSVNVNSLWDNNNTEAISTTLVDSLASQSYKELASVYNTSLGSGRRSIRIAVDPDTLVRELYKDNNIYAFPLYVKKDTSKPLLPNLSIAGKNIYPLDPPVTDEKDSARFVIVYGNTGAFINDSVTIAVRQFYQGSQVAAWTVRRKYPAETDTIVLTVPILKRAGEHQLQVELDPVGLIVESSESDNMANAFFTVVTTDFKVLQPTAFTTGSYATMIFLNPTTALAASARMAELELDTLDTFATAKKSVIPMQEFTTSYDISQLPKPGRYFWRIRQQNSGRGWSTGSFYLGASATYAIGQADEAAWSGNSFMHASYAAGSGAQIADTRLAIRAVSAGFSDGRTGSIDINGVNVLAPVFGTGHNLVVIDTSSMSLSQRRRFDPSNVPEESDSLSKFIASIPFGAIVADVVVDEGSNNLTQSARDALKTIGSASIDRLARRDSWAIIGRKGASAGSVPESYVPQFGGPASAETTFIRKEYAASISTQSFGPLASLSAFSMTGSIPAGSSVETRFIGTRFNNRIDTLLLTSGTALASTNLANTERYKEGRIVFSLQTSGASTPSILRWNLAAKAFTELAVSPQRASVSPQSVMEGEPVTFTGTIFNVSATPAESVTVQLAMNEGGLATVLRSQKIPVIAGNDSSVFSYRYETKGKRGTHAFTMTVDPMDSLLEQSKSNNTVSASFTIQSDTVRPQLIVAVDGQRVFDGDYVRQHPEINVRYTDNNPTAITAADTANFKIRLNNYPVYFAPGVAELVPSTSPGEAQLKWTPELPNGENFIQIYALDISGNSSDTTTLFVNVSSEFTLKDVYNLPNPFAGRTNFTFNILSPVNPDEVTIRIFTVAGRLIQTFSYPCRIGFNSFSWDGRDKDGDEIANGVYFYKVTVKQSDKQTDTISKLVKMK